ncbi:MAG: VCBS repeat-containing protein [Lentisphaeria bacterium]|nr:VCBS repeat-containing protein [Lentisphaeria bacterium]NQZ67661.1 VCBS repeat-containing protein [Lentisphaeria bacterium]
MKRNKFNSVVLVLAAMFSAHTSLAIINPNFTPIQLEEGSKLIAAVEVKRGASKDQYVVTVRKMVKGKTDVKAYKLDLSKARSAKAADEFRKLADADGQGLLFIGERETEDADVEAICLLHISGKWVSCVAKDKGSLLFDQISQEREAVWAGGTDMLRRCIDYILTDDEPDVPTNRKVAWGPEPVKVARLDGAIRAVRPVDLAGNGELLLFVASDKEDRLFAVDAKAKKLSDVTAARGLQSKSLAHAWGDFAGKGRLDLISYDGKTATLHAQQADGKFKSLPLDLGKALDHGCLSLTALDAGVKGRAGILVGGTALPVLVTLDADGKASATSLAAPGIDQAKLGKAGACLVADFNGDAIADVIALREQGSILFLGEAPGKFKPGTACAIKLGGAPSGACLGDYDADGSHDVLVANKAGGLLWANDGKGAFVESFAHSGEMQTHVRPNGVDCMTGDINNDGRQDIVIAYGKAGDTVRPAVFFNRGFRSFGEINDIEVPGAAGGHQRVCLADLDGDGAQDMVLALNNGEIWVHFRDNEDEEALMAAVDLPAGGAFKGPITVTGWSDGRCLGAWNVLPGVSWANFGRAEAGPVTIKWRLPGGKEQEKELILEDTGVVRVEIK